MRLVLILIFGFILSLFAEDIEKKGFFTTKWCAENGYFRDCPLESYMCGYGGCFKDFQIGDEVKKEELVLFIHDEGKYYNINPNEIHRYELDEAVNRNDVTIIGEFVSDSNTILAREYKAPPPPAKSFFKGCL